MVQVPPALGALSNGSHKAPHTEVSVSQNTGQILANAEVFDPDDRPKARGDGRSSSWLMRGVMSLSENFQDSVVSSGGALTCFGVAGAPLWQDEPAPDTLAHALRQQPNTATAHGHAYETLPVLHQAQIVQYAKTTMRAYAPSACRPNIKIDHLLGLDLETAENSAAIWQEHMTAMRLQAQHQLQPIVALSVSKIEAALAQKGFVVSRASPNLITSSAGMIAQVYARQSAEKQIEMIVAFPGLGAMDTARGSQREQQKQRLLAVIQNFLPFACELYEQAHTLMETLIANTQVLLGPREKPVNTTVLGHSLGGSFAMAAANNPHVNQCVAFQPLAPLWGKVHPEVRSKVIEVLITQDQTIPQLLQGCIHDTTKVVCQHNPQFTLPTHSFILPHLNSAIANR